MSVMDQLASRVGRRVHRLRRRASGPKARFIYDREYGLGVSGVPYDAFRSEHIMRTLATQGLVVESDILRPHTASFRDLCRVHDIDYLDELHRPGRLTRVLGVEVPEDEQEHIIDLYRRMVGGTIEAVRVAVETHLIGINLAGGFHHGFPDHGHGFCLFNDLAVGIGRLRSTGYTGRILIVDCDLHDGDGTRAFFKDDPSVHTFSIHNHDMDDGETQLEDTRIALGANVEDGLYLQTLEHRLPPVIHRFQPELVIYLAGADPARDDRIGDWNITAEGMFRRDRFVLEVTRGFRRHLPLAIVLAGGYSPHCWRYSARFFSFVVAGHPIEPPTSEEITLARHDQLRRMVDPKTLSGDGDEDADNPFALSQAELVASLEGRAPPTRFLEFYSKHGLELGLELYGVFDQIRSLGFPHPHLKLELDAPGGQILRVLGDRDESEPLVELQASRDRASVDGMELLRIDWLLLQNPKAQFTQKRPRLPGQRYPGLGLLHEVMGLLFSASVRLGLDGILFVPAHYHVAAQAQDILRFLRPEDAALFNAVQQALSGLDLVEASWAVEEQRVLDEVEHQPFEWRPMPMVLPVKDRLRERLQDEDYRRRFESAELGFAFFLKPEPTGARAHDQLL